MAQEGFTAEDYNKREISRHFLGHHVPISVFAPNNTTRKEFLELNPNVSEALYTSVERARLASKKSDQKELEESIAYLNWFGKAYGLRGIDKLVAQITDYSIQKPNGLLHYYGLRE